MSRPDLTLSRQRRGKGFRFCDAEGRTISDAETRQRILALGIPPAWTDVRIAADARGHIQAMGCDDAGRIQYIYHAEWEKRREARKRKKLAALTEALPRLRRHIAAALMAEAGSRELALGLAVALIDRTAMRVGREKYLETNGTRGAGTLFSRDVKVNGDEVCLTFDAKGGKKAQYCFHDAVLADAVARIKTLPGRRLLAYRDETGKVRALRTGSINVWLREASGVDISAKDFRTLHASARAGEALARLEVAPSETARKRQIAGVVREVSDVLRNTPAICRKSYIAPCLFTLFEQGKLAALWAAGGSGRAGLLAREKRLGAILAVSG